jgi:ribosomal protein L40E
MLNEVIIVMVYCVKCGVKNSDDATFCVKCGENLTSSQEKKWEWERRIDEWGEDVGKRAEKWGKQMEREFKDECFGLPHGGAIVGIIFGIIILILGFALLANINIWNYLGPIAIIIVGILIITGVAYRLIRR